MKKAFARTQLGAPKADWWIIASAPVPTPVCIGLGEIRTRIRTGLGSTAHSPAAVARCEQTGQLRNRLGGRLEVAADVLRLLVPRLRHQHQQGGALLAEVSQG